MRRGHTVPHEEVHIIKPNLDDDQDDNGDQWKREAAGSLKLVEWVGQSHLKTIWRPSQNEIIINAFGRWVRVI